MDASNIKLQSFEQNNEINCWDFIKIFGIQL